ncbi:FxsA family protein [Enemella sp. A6]|uniref:FxsA family protein n=1 Tax=Enemella sp. A6 TaxID=3440152 RepID=UPI003EBA5D67
MSADPTHPSPRVQIGAAPTPRRWALRSLIVAVLILVPLTEAWALSTVGRQIGVLATIGVVLLTSILGLVLVLREGSKAWRSLLEALREGRMPSRELVDGSLVVIGGLALLVPGLLSDLLGLVLLIPFTRSLVRRVIGAKMARQMAEDRIRSGVIPGEAEKAETKKPDENDEGVVVGQLLP